MRQERGILTFAVGTATLTSWSEPLTVANEHRGAVAALPSGVLHDLESALQL